MKEALLNRINQHTAKVSIVGLGYVGLPLAVEAAKCGFKVRGIEKNKVRCDQVNVGKSYIKDVHDLDFEQLVKKGSIQCSTGFESIQDADIIVICVPTPLTVTKEPDISYIVNSTEEICKYFCPGKLVILESTTYPGTTEEIILPRLEKIGMKIGRDFLLAFSPERVDPGNRVFNTANTSKIVGGLTADCLEAATRFYEEFVKSVIQVSAPRVAEMTKVFENIYRSVNIALVNELATLCEKMNIDVYEVIAAAATKPYGFQAFWPGPGVGGHCIPLDPYYLAWKGKEYDLHARFIELAGEINENQPRVVVSKIGEILNKFGKPLRGTRILQLGISYKKDVDDARESPAVRIYEHLTRAGAQVTVVDPFVPEFWMREHDFTHGNSGPSIPTQKLTDELMRNSDIVTIITDHSEFPYAQIVELAPLIFDTRNAMGFRKIASNKVYTLSTAVLAPPPRSNA